jgi:hypothetical protein
MGVREVKYKYYSLNYTYPLSLKRDVFICRIGGKRIECISLNRGEIHWLPSAFDNEEEVLSLKGNWGVKLITEEELDIMLMLNELDR